MSNMPSNRNFGITFSFVFLIVFILVKEYVILDILILLTSFIFFILGLANSAYLNILNLMWFKFGLFLGAIVAPIIMLLIFFIVLVPIGMIMQILSKNYLDIKKDNKKETYWIERKEKKIVFEDQF